MVKNFILAAMVGLGIAGIVFVTQNSTAPSVQNSQPQVSGNNSVSNQPFVEKLLPSNNLNASLEENLTELFTKGIGKTILENNPDGLANIDGKKGLVVPDPESVATELLAEAAQKFDPSKLRPIIKNSDLNVSQDNSKQAIQKYISNFQNILKSEAPKIPKTIFGDPENLTMEDINNLSNVYGAVADKFYKLPVPESVLDIHKKEIELSITKKNILEKIKNYQDDPITTILATQELKRVGQEFTELDKKFSDLIKKSGV